MERIGKSEICRTVIKYYNQCNRDSDGRRGIVLDKLRFETLLLHCLLHNLSTTRKTTTLYNIGTKSVPSTGRVSFCDSPGSAFALLQPLFWEQFQIKLWLTQSGEDIFSCTSVAVVSRIERKTAKEGLGNEPADRAPN